MPEADEPDPAPGTPAEGAEETTGEHATTWPGPWGASAAIAALCSLAVAYPVLQVLGADAAFFVARGALWWEPVLLAGVLCVLLPLAIVVLPWSLRLVSPRVAAAALVAVVSLCGALLGVAVVNQVAQDRPVSGYVVLLLGALAGALLGWLYVASPAVRGALRYGWLVPVAAAVLFLVLSPASRIVLAGEAQGAASLVASRTEATPPIVMIVFDEFPAVSLMRADAQVDEELFPNFARLAHDGVWYRDTTTVASFTTESVPAMLNGTYPQRDQLPMLADHPDNLLSLLSETYAVHASESVTQLCPDAGCEDPAQTDDAPGDRLGSLLSDTSIVAAHTLSPAEFRQGLPPLDDRWGGFGAETDEGNQTASEPEEVDSGEERDAFRRRFHDAVDDDRADHAGRFIETVRREAGSDEPQLFFLHTLLPHSPWQYLPSGRGYGATGTAGYDSGWADDWFAAQGRQRHLLQTAMVDGLVGDVVDALEDAGVYDESLIVLTADHGVAFETGHDRRQLSDATTGDIEAVPLFVKYPESRRRGIEDAPVETVDIVPTILEVLGAAGIPTDGESLLQEDLDHLRERDRTVYQRGEVIPLVGDEPPWRHGLDRKIDALGQAPGLDPLYRFGPHAELVGQRRDSLDLSDEPSDLRVALRAPDAFDDVDTDASTLPVHVVGEVSGADAEPGRYIAVTVNGVIEAIGKTIVGGDDRPQLRTLIPEDALIEGANDVQFDEIAQGDEEHTLRPILDDEP